MRFLLDQGVARSIVQLLIDAGHEAEHVGALGMARADDQRIMVEAIQRAAVIVTYDGDFHRLLYESGAAHPSVIRIRIPELNRDQAAAHILGVANQAADELARGAVVSITERNVRLRALPLISGLTTP